MCISLCIHMRICTCVGVCICKCVCIAYMRMGLHVYMYRRICLCICICMRICPQPRLDFQCGSQAICIYIYVYMCVYTVNAHVYERTRTCICIPALVCPCIQAQMLVPHTRAHTKTLAKARFGQEKLGGRKLGPLACTGSTRLELLDEQLRACIPRTIALSPNSAIPPPLPTTKKSSTVCHPTGMDAPGP